MKNKKKNGIEYKRNEIVYELYEKNGTASIVNSPNAYGNVVIPRSIEYQSKNYIITEIDKEAFTYNKSIQSISFAPDSEITFIDKFAFSHSTLMSISIPDSIENLEDGFGDGAYLLTDVRISSNHEKLRYLNDTYLLYDDVLIFVRRDVERANIPSIIKRIGERSFDTCVNLYSISFPEDTILEEISDYSFFHCSNLVDIKIPSSVKKIGDFSFYNCDKMIDFSYHNIADSQLFEIGRCIFFNSSIKLLIIPPSVSEIKEGFLHGVSKEIKLEFSPGNKHFNFYEDKYIIKNGIIIYAKKDIENANIPSFVTRIGDGSFEHCMSLKSINFEKENQSIYNLKQIGQYAFSNCVSLTYLEYPSTIEYMDDYSFHNCVNLEYVKMKNDENSFQPKLDKIGNNSFSQCRKLKTFIFPSTIRKISKGSFSDCENLENVVFSTDENHEYHLKLIDNFAFSNCSKLSNFFFPSTVIKIGQYAFYNCVSLSELDINDDSCLESICSFAFSSTKIDKLWIPKSVKILEESCFHNALKKIHIDLSPNNKNVRIIDKTLFVCDDCIVFSRPKLVCLLIPSSVKKIGNYAFHSISTLKYIKFDQYGESKLAEINDNAFSYCSLIKVRSFPKNLVKIGSSAFFSNKWLPSIEFLADQQIFLDEYCFEKCVSLLVVSFPNAKKIKIGYMSFLNVGDDFTLLTLPKAEFVA